MGLSFFNARRAVEESSAPAKEQEQEQSKESAAPAKEQKKKEKK